MYIPLGIKTDYSILSSLIKINDLIKTIKEYGYNAVGIIDDNLSYVMEFYKECKKNDIKPIIGLELLLDNKTIYLYAKNYNGYQNLCYISSNEISVDLIKNNSYDLLLLLPLESIDLYDVLNIPDTYIINNGKEIDDKYKKINMNVVKCINKDDNIYLKYLYMIKEGKTISDNISDEVNCHLYKKEELSLSKEELDSYDEIYNACNLEIIKNDLLPVYNSDKNFDENKYLEELCKKGLLKRFNNKVPLRYADRLMEELEVIKRMGFSNYFLVVWDYVKFAKKNNILVGPGRGSAAGSLVSYSLGITEIDPLKYDLYFERFLNPERITMPDIDIDFEANKRDEVVNYIVNKYGLKKVTNIITFGTLKPKMVLRDVARIFNIENKIDSFIKLFDSDISLEDNYKKKTIIDIKERDTLISTVCNISLKLEGLKRLTSVHAAGVIISNEELDRYIPIVKNDEIYTSLFSKDYIEELGLLKMDILALDNLVLISNLVNDIGNIDLNKIPLDDEKTLDIFRNVKTDGIFQFESIGMKNTLRKFKVKSFNDIVAIIALFRPGPMDNIDSYIKRMQGKEKIDYLSDDLKEVLESTYGIIIYQEQIMRIANIMAGYSLGEADVLRRAMSKKNKEMMEKERIKFIEGAINKGYSEELANKVFDYINRFASYGFNKAHSVSYSIISYQMAYLKAHYKVNYMAYLLSMEIGNETKTKQYINECKLDNIDVLKPDINKSSNIYLIENNNIRFPFSAIKNVGQTACNIIIKEREENGDYKDIYDFVSRTYKKGINKKILTNLINSSSFDSFNINKKTLIDNIDILINYAELTSGLDNSLIDKPEIESLEEYSKDELTKIEFNTFGFYLSSHPVQQYRDNDITTLNLKENFNNNITIYLLVDSKRDVITKKNEKMLFITGSDEFSSVDLVVFPKVLERFYNINKSEVYKFTAKVEKRFNEYQLIVSKIESVKI